CSSPHILILQENIRCLFTYTANPPLKPCSTNGAPGTIISIVQPPLPATSWSALIIAAHLRRKDGLGAKLSTAQFNPSSSRISLPPCKPSFARTPLRTPPV